MVPVEPRLEVLDVAQLLEHELAVVLAEGVAQLRALPVACGSASRPLLHPAIVNAKHRHLLEELYGHRHLPQVDLEQPWRHRRDVHHLELGAREEEHLRLRADHREALTR